MSLEQRISKGIMEAMKAKDTVRLSALRNAKKYIIEAKTSGPSRTAPIWRRRNWLRWPSIRSFCPGSSRPRS